MSVCSLSVHEVVQKMQSDTNVRPDESKMFQLEQNIFL